MNANTQIPERRYINAQVAKFETRLDGDKKIIRGYAAVFNSMSEDLGGFREVIAPGFFDSVLGNDVRCLFNHDSNMILGRTTSATCRIGVDATGLYFEYDDPDTTYSQDLMKSMQRGDITQCSFGFSLDYDAAKSDDWKKSADGTWTRTLLVCGRLYDVSPVTYPAYPDTMVSARSIEAFKKHSIETSPPPPPPAPEYLRSIDRVRLSTI